MKKRLAQASTLLPLAIGASTALLSSHIATESRSSSSAATFGHDHLACALPFDPIKKRHPIDAKCGLQGNAKEAPQIAQNRAKNNFCAKGVPSDLQLADFLTLQKAASERDVTFGNDAKIPEDRSPLKDIPLVGDESAGEGDLVRVVAYVVDAHPSDKDKGESVNCKTPGVESNDVHVVLGDAPNANQCTSVTAEISPHYRPAAWTAQAINKLTGRPFRFKGPLLFDASHAPCVGAHRPNPKRSSLFEVHPVYSIEVCALEDEGMSKPQFLEACRTASKDKWIALEDWGDSQSTDESDNG